MRKKTDTKNEDGFLSRWSDEKSRKQNPLIETPNIDGPDIEETHLPGNDKSQSDLDADDQLSSPGADEKPALTDEDMPDIETLDEKSDFSGFLSPGVSDELQKLALRKLFRSKVFNVRDGLDDYDDDFRSFAVLGDIITSDMKHRIELAEEKKKQAEEEKLALEMQAEEKQAQEKLEQEKQTAKQTHDEIEHKESDEQNKDSDDQLAMQESSETDNEIKKNEATENKPNATQDKHIADKKTAS